MVQQGGTEDELVLKADSAADYVRWTAAVASVVSDYKNYQHTRGANVSGEEAAAQDAPVVNAGPREEGGIPLYAKVGGDSEGTESGDEARMAVRADSGMILVHCGWLYRKKTDKSSFSKQEFVKRYFRLLVSAPGRHRKVPPVLEYAPSPTAPSKPHQQMELGLRLHEAMVAAAVAEGTGADVHAPVEQKATGLVEILDTGSKPPPSYVVEVEIVAVKDLPKHMSLTGSTDPRPFVYLKGQDFWFQSPTAPFVSDGLASWVEPEEPEEDREGWLGETPGPERSGVTCVLPVEGASETMPASLLPHKKAKHMPIEGSNQRGISSFVDPSPPGVELRPAHIPEEEKGVDCGDGRTGDVASVLLTDDVVNIMIFREKTSRFRSATGEKFMGAALFKLDSLPLNRTQGYSIPLYDSEEVLTGANPEQANFNCKGKLQLRVRARRLYPCITRWPCAWVPLTRDSEPACPPVGAASFNDPESAAAALPLYCQAFPDTLHLYVPAESKIDELMQQAGRQSLGGDAPQAKGLSPERNWSMRPCLELSYEELLDVVEVGPACLHIHFMGRGSSMVAKSTIRGFDEAILYSQNCAMEERLQNTIISAKQQGMSYETWLHTHVGKEDYMREFVSQDRKNEKFHRRWESYGRTDKMTFDYTDLVPPMTVTIPEDVEERGRFDYPHPERDGDTVNLTVPSGKQAGDTVDFEESHSSNPEKIMAMATQRLKNRRTIFEDSPPGNVVGEHAAEGVDGKDPSELELAFRRFKEHGGHLVLRIAPCPAALMASILRERQRLHQLSSSLRVMLRESALSHWEAASHVSPLGTLGLAGTAVRMIQKQLKILRKEDDDTPAASTASDERRQPRGSAGLSSAPMEPSSGSGGGGGGGGGGGAGMPLPLISPRVTDFASPGSPNGATTVGFDHPLAQTFRLRLYLRRIQDENFKPLWAREEGTEMRLHFFERVDFCMHGSKRVLLSEVPESLRDPASRAVEGQVTLEILTENPQEDVKVDDYIRVLHGQQMSVQDTAMKLEQLLVFFDDLLMECYLAFIPFDGYQYRVHCQLAAKIVYLCAVRTSAFCKYIHLPPSN